MTRTLLAAAACGAWLCAAAPVDAATVGENRDKAVTAARTTTPPVIDGRLDEPAWAAAPADDRFRQSYPDDGLAPTERTEVRVLYDDDALYVGVRCFDTRPKEIVARLTRRDRKVESDVIGVSFDSRHDHASAYSFYLNAAGVQGDVLSYADTEQSFDWEAVWDGATSRDSGGWSAELRVPLSALRFDAAPAHTWGFQVFRYISRKNEVQHWSWIPQGTNADVSRWGHLVGLEGLRPRRTFELRPFTVASLRARTGEGIPLLGVRAETGIDTEPAFNAGLDLKVGLTTNLTLDATINPDFGQVEADQIVLNLSRFESYFPEKRPFFLEGSELFATPLQVFYSRRIGEPQSAVGRGSYLRGDDGTSREVLAAPTSAPIWSALKLTGRAGDSLAVGALAALTGTEDLLLRGPGGGVEELRGALPRGWAAIRLRYSRGGASYLGAMATAVNRLGATNSSSSSSSSPTRNHDAYVQSLDGNLATTDGAFSVSGQAVVSERVGGPSHVDEDGAECTAMAGDATCVPITRADGTTLGPGDVGVGAVVTAAHSGPRLHASATYRALSPRLYLNDLGFLTEASQHHLKLRAGLRDRQRGRVFQTHAENVSARLTRDWHGVGTGGGADLSGDALFANQWYLNSNLGVSLPGTWDPYETGDGAYFEKGASLHGHLFAKTDERKLLVVSASSGGYVSLTNESLGVSVSTGLELNAHPQLELALELDVGLDANSVRNWFYGGCVDAAGEPCAPGEAGPRSYRFAELDSGSLSGTLRSTYTFSPRLSLQAYAQLFASRGSFGNRLVLDADSARPFLRRDELRADASFTGDLDGDGRPDDAFQDTTLNVNVVLRWELRPGTTLLGVYTRAQQAAFDLDGAAPTLKLTGLSTGPTEEVLTFKLVYFIG